jgi:hypothetical protein
MRQAAERRSTSTQLADRPPPPGPPHPTLGQQKGLLGRLAGGGEGGQDRRMLYESHRPAAHFRDHSFMVPVSHNTVGQWYAGGMIQVGWRLPDELVRWVRVQAAERGVSQGVVAAEALESARNGTPSSGPAVAVDGAVAAGAKGSRGDVGGLVETASAPARAPRRAASLSETWAR